MLIGPPVLILLLANCASFNRSLDRSGLEDKVEVAISTPDAGTLPAPLPFTDEVSLEELTRAAPLVHLKIKELIDHRYDDETLIQEKLTFETPIPLRHAESNQATAYIYRHGKLGERPVILWVPGLYVSDIAFKPIFWFFEEIFERDIDIVFYVLPYHLERTPEGMESGDAMLATDLSDHFRSLAQGLAELRSLSQWLREEGVQTLGAFGGSTGANLLLRQLTFEPAYDFLSVFIPLVSWEDVIYDNPLTGPLRERIRALPPEQQKAVRKAWKAMSPISHPPHLTQKKISTLRARWDQVARKAPLDALKKDWKLERCFVFNRGHTLALFSSDLYDAYGEFLDEDMKAF